MGWTSPRDWVTDEIVTEAMMDTHVKDNLNYLKDKEFYLSKRQGGLATDWGGAGAGGSTDYTPTAGETLLQCGMWEWSGSAASSGSGDVTFPTTFGYSPLVLLTVMSYGELTGGEGVFVRAFTGAGRYDDKFTMTWAVEDGGTIISLSVAWLAIGPSA